VQGSRLRVIAPGEQAHFPVNQRGRHLEKNERRRQKAEPGRPFSAFDPRDDGIKIKAGGRDDGEPKKVFYLSLVNGAVERHATWSECEAKVKGRPGVKFKKVSSEAEAEEVLRGWGVKN
jgi:hypothetical protein